MSIFLEKMKTIAENKVMLNGIVVGQVGEKYSSFSDRRELELRIVMAPNVPVAPNADYNVLRRSLVNQIAHEVYADIRVRLDEYINERLIDGDGRDELIAIREMME
jgi:hypothetical protein